MAGVLILVLIFGLLLLAIVAVSPHIFDVMTTHGAERVKKQIKNKVKSDMPAAGDDKEAMVELKKRYAKGEIEKPEFEEKKQDIES